MIKKLNFPGAFILLVFLTIFVFPSCQKEKLNEEESFQIEEIQTTTDLELFLSREKTYNLLAPSAFNWEKPINQISNRNDEILNLQTVITEINTQLSERYVTSLINKVGYPLWDASVLQLLDDNGGYSLVTPVFKVGSDKINALFIYTHNANGKTSYSLTSREVMEANAMNLKDPNFVTKVNLYEHFDKLLFNYEPPIYASWKDLVRNDEFIDCFSILDFRVDDVGPVIGTGVVTCADGCWDNLYNSVINTTAERDWASGHCDYTQVLNDFWEESDLEHKDAIAQFFLNLIMEELYDIETFEGAINGWSNNINAQIGDFLLSNDFPVTLDVAIANCISTVNSILDEVCAIETIVIVLEEYISELNSGQIDLTNPPVSSIDPLCPAMFEFDFLNPLESTPTTMGGGIKELQIQVGSTVFVFQNLMFFVGESNVNCNQDHESSAAQSVNAAVADINNRIGTAGFPRPNWDLKTELLASINRIFILTITSPSVCGAVSNVSGASAWRPSPFVEDDLDNAPRINFSQFSTLCP